MHNYHSLVPSHENQIVVGSWRNLIPTLIVTAEQNIWIIQYHTKNFTENKLTSLGFNNIPAIAEILKRCYHRFHSWLRLQKKLFCELKLFFHCETLAKKWHKLNSQNWIFCFQLQLGKKWFDLGVSLGVFLGTEIGKTLQIASFAYLRNLSKATIRTGPVLFQHCSTSLRKIFVR